MTRLTLVVVGCVAGLAAMARGAQPAVTPLADHPGNVFLAGERVIVPAEGGSELTVVDYEGKTIGRVKPVDGKLDLGQLGVGYYELREKERRVTTVGVLAPLAAATPASSPIAMDVAMAWFYGEKQMPAAANLSALAGMSWVRDRLSWGEVERERGRFVDSTRYDASARIQSAAGLRVLQVMHISPRWTGAEAKRFPPDLRDAHRFWKQMAQRWKGQVLAFEPWNEADIDVFGGHSGQEMAAMQKASYLGLKAGNPDVIGCLNVFAINRKATIEDLAANEAWPYFDTCNLHHYIPVDRYPDWYESFRAICAGRPLWVTEFSMPVPWADEKTHEPSDEMLRNQAERVAMAFAASLHEGTAAAFFFLLPHYVEGKTQFGIVHRDLTPRPAYVALAAVGRLLADARAIGKKSDGDLRLYAFSARPDGRLRDVVVMWRRAGEQVVNLGAEPVEAFDHLGRAVDAAEGKVKVSKPVFAVLPAGAAKNLNLEPAPKLPQWKEGKPSPVVLQALLPGDRLNLARSAYRISSQKPQTIPVFVYNFGLEIAKARLSASGPDGWKVGIARELEIAPGQRQELALSIDCDGKATRPVETLRVEGDLGPLGRAVMSVRVEPEPLTAGAAEAMAIAGADDVARWQKEVSGGSSLSLTAAEGGVKVQAQLGDGDRWVYPRLDLLQHERAPKNAREVRFKLTVHEGDAHYRIIFVEDNGAGYVGEPMRQPTVGKTLEVAVLLEESVIGNGWSPPDANGKLDPEQVKAIKIGCNARSGKVGYTVGDVRWVK